MHEGIYRIVYTGGPAHAQFAALRSIPKPDVSIIRQFTYPTIHKDGCIEYPNGPTPPTPEGYEAVTPFIFKPVWVFCLFRHYHIRLRDEGYLEIVGKCVNPASGIRARDAVTNAFCKTCPKRLG
jgi:hypothetical protein